jgi:hypothetical protein
MSFGIILGQKRVVFWVRGEVVKPDTRKMSKKGSFSSHFGSLFVSFFGGFPGKKVTFLRKKVEIRVPKSSKKRQKRDPKWLKNDTFLRVKKTTISAVGRCFRDFRILGQKKGHFSV